MRKILVTMLGGFTIRDEEMKIGKQISLSGRSRRLWTLVALLILNRDRGITAQELIDLLWPEAEGENPMSTLQNNVSRSRNALAELGLKDPKSLISFEDGRYFWAPGVETVVDAESFDELMKLANHKKGTEEGLEAAVQALDIYKGDFLTEAAQEAWCVNINAYYRSSYIRLARTTIKALYDLERIEDVERICSVASSIDLTVEEFTVYLMKALRENKNPKKALEEFEHIKRFFKQTYGVDPSPELEAERAAAVRELYGKEMGDEEVANFLHRTKDEPGAFFCDNGVFVEIVKLHVREVKRSGQPCLVVLLNMNSQDPKLEKQALCMKRLESVLTAALRTGDPFTKVSASQFLMLLPGAIPENGDKVIFRAESRFRRDYPLAKVSFSHKIYELLEIAD